MRTQIDLRLARHGAILLLLGMLTGFVIGDFHNRGAGDAAHLVGLIGGYGLIATALLWPRLSLGRWSGAGAGITVASLYLNWLGVIFLVLGGGSNSAHSAIPGSPAFWNLTGEIVLKTAVFLSLLSVLIIPFGLRNVTTPTTEPQGTARAPVTTG